MQLAPVAVVDGVTTHFNHPGVARVFELPEQVDVLLQVLVVLVVVVVIWIIVQIGVGDILWFVQIGYIGVVLLISPTLWGLFVFSISGGVASTFP